MEAWRIAWRRIAHELPTKGLSELLVALQSNSPQLTRGITVQSDNDTPSCACAIAFAIWKGDQLTSAREIKVRFISLRCRCFDDRFTPKGESAPQFYDFTEWFDDGDYNPEQLADEVRLELHCRSETTP